jgi:hypothetical protein
VEPKGEPAGNLKGKFAGMDSACWWWCAALSPLASRTLSLWLAFKDISWLAPSLSPSVLFLPAVFLSPGPTKWIPPKILLPLTIKMISKQSHRTSRISFPLHSPSCLALSFLSLAERPPWSEVPVLALSAALLKSASLLFRYRKFVPHQLPYR